VVFVCNVIGVGVYVVVATGDPGVSVGANGVVAEQLREAATGREGTCARGVEAAGVQEGST